MMELEVKAQQLPHPPWSLTWVMTPWSLQSTESGKSSSLISFLLFGANLVLARAGRECWADHLRMWQQTPPFTEKLLKKLIFIGTF